MSAERMDQVESLAWGMFKKPPFITVLLKGPEGKRSWNQAPKPLSWCDEPLGAETGAIGVGAGVCWRRCWSRIWSRC